jgi:hypothetical protein
MKDQPKKRRPNRTSFKPGPDPRRHRFSNAQQKKGHAHAVERALERGWDLSAWLYRKVRSHYRRKGQWQPDNAKLTGRKS